MDYASLFNQAGQQFNVDPALAMAVMQQESGGNPQAVSPKGALGPMQLMPDTAKMLGVDPTDAAQNVLGGVKYLGQLLDKYGDVAKAVAAYNAGPGAVDKAGGIPAFPETQNYVKSVLTKYQGAQPPQAVAPGLPPAAGSGAATVDPFAGIAADPTQAAPTNGVVDPFAGLPAAKSAAAQKIANDAITQGAAPTADMSTWDKLLAGTGMGMAKIGRAVAQPFGLASQGDINEAARLDNPLASTGAGKVGNFVGQTAMVAPAAFLPGANTYLGSAAIGAGLGGLTTDGGLKDRALGATFGAAGGLAGKGLGDLLSYGINQMAAARIAAQANNAGRDAAATAARGAGYVIPPADTNPTLTNELLNGLSGKIKTAQVASAQNQPITNDLVKAAVGAPADQPLSINALNSIRNNASQAYQSVASTGTVFPGQSYDAALDKIVAPFKQAAAGFPNAKPNPIISEIESLRSPQFDASSAIAKIGELRSSADTAYAAGNKDAGRAFKSAASALEDVLDQHLQAVTATNGLLGMPNNIPPNALDNFRNARQLIAKTYSVQGGLNDVTGDVSAQALAKQLQKGKPLTGNLLTVAQTAAAFPKATQALKEAPKQLSPLDFVSGLLAASSTGHPAAALLPIARPAVRSAILSGPYQSTLGVPSYQPMIARQLLEKALASQAAQRAMVPQAALFGAGFAAPNAPQGSQ